MTNSGRIIAALWLVLFLYWIIAAGGAKRSIGTRWQMESGLRLVVLIIVVIALRTPQLREALRGAQAYEAGSMAMGITGVLLCALGVGLAIVARVQLGRNWGMPTTRKEHPELVTAGPYAVIRHPIYTGMLIAMIGSAIGESAFWCLPLILFGVYFIYSARREEKLMTEQFPEQYPAYMARTKMLLPLLL
ncbi:MAG TPA: isoprenylcysteine carboxylmethyltransferase family protein [Steroidobacteraceae bacterium]|jgi:protein-S-isoprenylcysteine O-methyltransferase Ste14|nr:isoprenylcysteine carboxylmethyltransferase family protein [Steroidobacteraceae bacterium]